MSAATVLRLARTLIADEAHWTRGTYARTDQGNSCDSLAEAATRWCMTGAVRKVTLDGEAGPYRQAMTFIEAVLETDEAASVAEFNDDPVIRHCDVLALYGRAIALADVSVTA
jgi:hypothetical protein